MALPSGFRRLKCIRSTGTQCIDTRFKPKYNSRVVVDISDLKSTGFVFGTRSEYASTAANQFSVFRNTATTMRSDYFGTNATASISDTTQRTTIDKSGNVVTLYGTTITNSAVTSGECPSALMLFALITTDGGVTNHASLTMYSGQIYDAADLAHDYIPAMRISDNKPGLYDDVTGEFLTNAGTGEFEYEEIEPTGDHRTMVDAVIWGVPSGRCLVDGVGYSIQKGRTLIGGVGYDVLFGPSIVKVTITGSGHRTLCYAVINGATHSSATTGLEVTPGSSIDFYTYGKNGYIEIDGSIVAQNSSSVGAESDYSWVIPNGISEITINLTTTGASISTVGTITVTTA